MNPLYWVYDLETYPNIFTAYFIHPATGAELVFEISDRKNELADLLEFLHALHITKCYLIGFNNIGFDYPILHQIMVNAYIDLNQIYATAQRIINTSWERRFDNIIYDADVIIPQIDLFKIHHFDNEARRTSLKVLEFNMRSASVDDLPFPPCTVLNDDQKNTLIEYNRHDVIETVKLMVETLPMIEFRRELSEKFGRNFLNHNDTKIGKDYFVMELEKALPGSCYEIVDGRRKPRQTRRDSIHLKDVIFPYISFFRDEFDQILQYFKSQTISETKGTFTDLSCVVDGFKFVFGVGGIHASIPAGVVESDDNYVIYDWDVASYYPNLAIANKLYPEHLSEQFCTIYQDVYNQRRKYSKTSAENAMLKLALNGVYGDSNNKYSPFYDSKYTMAITINGQLLLCLLAQYLMQVPGLKMIQANTDGLTVRLPRSSVDQMTAVCEWWQKFNMLELESVIYKRMFIRDVNNYIAEKDDGKLKRKGAYSYVTKLDDPNTREIQWHNDHSSLVVPKAVEGALIRGVDPRQFICGHPDPFDFMILAKAKGRDILTLDGVPMQKTTRFYVSTNGGRLIKTAPPVDNIKPGTWKRKNGITDSMYRAVIAEIKNTGDDHDVTGCPWDERINTKNRSIYDERASEINAGWLSSVCNVATDFNWSNLNYEYYINEADKLIKVMK